MKKNGGPAFPGSQVAGYLVPNDFTIKFPETAKHMEALQPAQMNGMSLRDWFATHAPEVPNWFSFIEPKAAVNDLFFKWRWYYADSMLKERDK